MIAEIEERYNAELVETETFDPGPAFLGNHADIISVGTFEIAAIEEETGMMLRWRPAEAERRGARRQRTSTI